MDDWLWMSACDLGRGIDAGEIEPVALTQAYLDAAGRHAHRDRIYTVLTPDRALAEAEASAHRARHGVRRGLLDGVPISWKDLFDSAGVATEAGSRLLEGRVPEADCDVLARATRAGLVCLGKTHMSELAFAGLGLNPAYRGTPEGATPPNVHDPACVPGGSSSGAAASTAFGVAAAGIGSDTGGSVRVPAAWNDLVGLKTTSGRLSLEGVVPLAETFDTVGPLCRSVEDCAYLLAAMEGGAVPDLSNATLQGARFLVLGKFAEDAAPEQARGFAFALEKLAEAGAQIETGHVPAIDPAMDLSPVLFAAEAYGIWRDAIEAAPEKMFDRVRDRFRGGADFSAPDYVAAWRKLRGLRKDWARTTAAYDAILLPTTANAPPEIARLMADADYYVAQNLLTLRNTRVGNLMGLSGLTLPTGVAAAGLMMLAPPMAEERLLRLGAAAEAALT
ncbi:amidase family protein [Roseibacterium sp. SDUM158017]|uniref:amidase n=1 Tax=Roseicyclus salinarum TaxID=3036773 RepID=UPI0024154333|nr:amidase family protein [Roseibacterium sp. SDUM158017]MDG4650577.1 amidase family protein [Roseibacterium sp. SDUM158017]